MPGLSEILPTVFMLLLFVLTLTLVLALGGGRGGFRRRFTRLLGIVTFGLSASLIAVVLAAAGVPGFIAYALFLTPLWLLLVLVVSALYRVRYALARAIFDATGSYLLDHAAGQGEDDPDADVFAVWARRRVDFVHGALGVEPRRRSPFRVYPEAAPFVGDGPR